jgi:hypothetical protein
MYRNGRLQCLALTALAVAARSPLDCFTDFPRTNKADNICSGTYTVKSQSGLAECAALCLADPKCDAFATSGGTDCRRSSTCPAPTSHNSNYDGYQRKPGCVGPAPAISFASSAGLFGEGMILQRGDNTRVWGSGAKAGATVKVTVGGAAQSATAAAQASGSWEVTLPSTAATASTTLTASDGTSNVTLRDVAFGDVILCGGQSNMGFGMCGAQSATQSPSGALNSLAPLRMFFQSGSGPNGGTGETCAITTIDGKKGTSGPTPAFQWFASNATNSGGYSANCLLTAQRLHAALGGQVPVGAVESCVGGTPVTDWTPSQTNATEGGVLWVQHMVPLLPMTFGMALWDQGEADAKRTNSSYYATEFPLMIRLWRKYFNSATAPDPFPFVYVELCTEYGAEAPR